jgi:hypothetical protein
MKKNISELKGPVLPFLLLIGIGLSALGIFTKEQLMVFFMDYLLPFLWLAAALITLIFYISWKKGKINMNFLDKQPPV